MGCVTYCTEIRALCAAANFFGTTQRFKQINLVKKTDA